MGYNQWEAAHLPVSGDKKRIQREDVMRRLGLGLALLCLAFGSLILRKLVSFKG